MHAVVLSITIFGFVDKYKSNCSNISTGKHMKIFFYLTAVLIIFTPAALRADTENNKSTLIPELEISGYVEGYYGVSDADPVPAEGDEHGTSGGTRPLNANSLTSDQFGLNWAHFGLGVHADIYRAHLSLQGGEMPTKYFHGALDEAIVGFRLFDNFWIDGGHFVTPVGGEAFWSNDNLLSTYSMLTYVGPFYHTGIKLSYEGEHFFASAGVVDGMALSIEDNNASKSAVAVLGYETGNISICYAGYFGNNQDAGLKEKMYTHNNLNIEVSEIGIFNFKFQADVITQAESYNQDELGIFYGVSFQTKADITEKIKAAARIEYFDNSKAVFLFEPGSPGYAFTAGWTYRPVESGFIRLEGRYLAFTDDSAEHFFHRGKHGEDSSADMFDAVMTFGYRFSLHPELKEH